MYHHCRDKYDQVSTRKPLGIMHCLRRFLTVIVISIVGAALIYTSNDLWTDFAGLALLGIYSTGMPLSLAMISSNVGGFTKRATVSSLLFLAYCTGNIIGPQLFFAREAPKYKVPSRLVLPFENATKVVANILCHRADSFP